jgi:hypothetical protein
LEQERDGIFIYVIVARYHEAPKGRRRAKEKLGR